MNMKKANYVEKMAEISDRQSQQNTSDLPKLDPVVISKPKSTIPPATPRKICPITGNNCNSKCKLFRFNKAGHNCPLQEVFAVSWKLNTIELILTAFAKKNGIDYGEESEN